jgi:type I restriction enzyme S subunit
VTRTTPKIDIRPDHWEMVRGILQKHVPQHEVWAFGSRAKWTAKEFSDLDLAVISDKPLSLSVSASLSEAFSESDLPYKVDVVDWATTSESFRRMIERDKVVVKRGGTAVRTRIVEIVDFNPSRPIKRGVIAPFVDMAALPEHQRDIASISKREFTGAGSRFQNGDTLFARITPCLENGKTAKVSIFPDGTIAHGSTEFIVMAAKAPDYDEDYVYYLARHPEFRAFAEARMEGTSGRQRVSWQALADFSFTFPTPYQRKTIGFILRKLDDKISLNRRINQTLEAMAQAIFKSWFVDFDPVKAKIAAKQQGRDPLRAAMSAISGKADATLDALPPDQHAQLAATAALFPDEMEDSALGGIPKGWGAKSLDSIANYLNGLALQNFSPKSSFDFLPVIKIAQLRAGHTEGADKAASNLKPEYVVCDGDVLFSWSGSLEVDVWTGGRGALNQHLFKVTSSVVPKWFYLLATKHHLPQFREIAANKATTMGHIQRKHLSDARIATPSPEFLNQATKMISPLLDETISLRLQSRQLAKTRDTLLPKLLSGELSVTEARAEAAA